MLPIIHSGRSSGTPAAIAASPLIDRQLFLIVTGTKPTIVLALRAAGSSVKRAGTARRSQTTPRSQRIRTRVSGTPRNHSMTGIVYLPAKSKQSRHGVVATVHAS
jgi:hypothetical protein